MDFIKISAALEALYEQHGKGNLFLADNKMKFHGLISDFFHSMPVVESLYHLVIDSDMLNELLILKNEDNEEIKFRKAAIAKRKFIQKNLLSFKTHTYLDFFVRLIFNNDVGIKPAPKSNIIDLGVDLLKEINHETLIAFNSGKNEILTHIYFSLKNYETSHTHRTDKKNRLAIVKSLMEKPLTNDNLNHIGLYILDELNFRKKLFYFGNVIEIKITDGVENSITIPLLPV